MYNANRERYLLTNNTAVVVDNAIGLKKEFLLVFWYSELNSEANALANFSGHCSRGERQDVQRCNC